MRPTPQRPALRPTAPRLTALLLTTLLLPALLLPALLLLTACAKTPKQARRELADMGYRYGREAFAECVARGDSTALDLFLLAGMAPDTETGGYTVLERAHGDPVMVARLLAAGGDPDGHGGVSTPLIEAVGAAQVGAVRLLLDAGADADLADGTGRTPLMAAAEVGDTTLAHLLLDAGADVNARSALGATPLSVALSRDHAAVAAVLRRAGARRRDGPNLEALMDPARLDARAPDRFEVALQTSVGDLRVEVIRAWAPHGADRFHNLVAHGFFDGQRIFRVVRDRLVQFGLHGRPEVARRWYGATIPDDPATHSNVAGTLGFASGGEPDSRSTQVYVNLTDNPDFDRAGLVPFGRVVDGLERLRGVEARYGELPDQGSIVAEGNEYLDRDFPGLSVIREARLVR